MTTENVEVIPTIHINDTTSNHVEVPSVKVEYHSLYPNECVEFMNRPGRTFPSQQKLFRINTNASEEINCDIDLTCQMCEQEFSSLEEIKNHGLLHVNKSLYTCLIDKNISSISSIFCNICGIKFNCCEHLSEHKFCHSVKGKLFKCSSCSKKFHQRYNVKCHQSTYSNKRCSKKQECSGHKLSYRKPISEVTKDLKQFYYYRKSLIKQSHFDNCMNFVYKRRNAKAKKLCSLMKSSRHLLKTD